MFTKFFITMNMILFCIINSANADKILAHSKKLNMSFTAIGNPWCQSSVKISVKSDDINAFDSPDYMSIIKKLGFVLSKECPQINNISITDIAQHMAKWRGTALKKDGWLIKRVRIADKIEDKYESNLVSSKSPYIKTGGIIVKTYKDIKQDRYSCLAVPSSFKDKLSSYSDKVISNEEVIELIGHEYTSFGVGGVGWIYSSSNKMIKNWNTVPEFVDIYSVKGIRQDNYPIICGNPDGYISRLDEMKQKAESGDAIAQNQLARAYREGHYGAGINDVEFVKWTRKSAENGFSPAQQTLGALYLHGHKGVRKDEAIAQEWFRKAAAQGDAFSQKKLLKIEQEKLSSKTPRAGESDEDFARRQNRITDDFINESVLWW